MSIDAFCQWLQRTAPSVAIQSTEWIIPAVQTVHILAIAAVVSAAVALTLRALEWTRRDVPQAGVAAGFAPVLWWALPILLATGAILIVAEPARALENPVFFLKMGLVVAASLATLTYQLPLRRNAEFWQLTRRRTQAGRAVAVMSLLLWSGVIISGRFIAYVGS
jgi:hypothetical protein